MSDTDPTQPAEPVVPQPPVALPASSFFNADATRKAVKLAYPVLYPPGPSARRYETVFVRKLTVGQIRTAQDNYRKALEADPDVEPDFQMIVDEQGSPLPRAMLDLIEADDDETLNEAVLNFLPRRFHRQTSDQDGGSAPATGASTGPS